MGATTLHVIDGVQEGRHHEIVRLAGDRVEPLFAQQHVIARRERNAQPASAVEGARTTVRFVR
ncbi:hypothetical protein RSP795_00270 [Ralstonia solanacearum]|nr:hypothetical protein RSP795_00270 [Ralstonia solanacearum]